MSADADIGIGPPPGGGGGDGGHGQDNGNGTGSKTAREIIAEICAGPDDQPVTLHDLLHAFGLRAFGLLILIFALPNGIPAPIAPGLSAVLGLPLLLLSAQMLVGLDHPWFPASWQARSFRRADVARLLRPTLPVLERIERYVKPRYLRLTGSRGRNIIGGLILWNAILLSLPIPFGNLIPAWGIILVAFGQIERDGLLVIAGMGATVVGTGWVVVLLEVGIAVLERLFA